LAIRQVTSPRQGDWAGVADAGDVLQNTMEWMAEVVAVAPRCWLLLT
jgi:hypothetical protein